MELKLQLKIYFATIAVLAILFVILSINVIKFRRKYLVLYGASGHILLKAAIRAQANFAEYVPITLLLFIGLMYFQVKTWLFASLCLLLCLSRILHSIGIIKYERLEPPVIAPRFFGMIGTLGIIIFSAMYLLIQVFYRTLS